MAEREAAAGGADRRPQISPAMYPSKEVAAAARTRQKSCNACVRSKRRCDQGAPVCSRCAERAVICFYPKTGGHDAAAAEPTGPVPPLPDAQRQDQDDDGQPAAAPDLNSAPAPSGLFDFLNSTTTPAFPPLTATKDAHDNDIDMTADHFFDFASIDVTSPSSESMWLAIHGTITNGPTRADEVQEDEAVAERPGTPADEDTRRSYDKMYSLVVRLPNPFHPRADATTTSWHHLHHQSYPLVLSLSWGFYCCHPTPPSLPLSY